MSRYIINSRLPKDFVVENVKDNGESIDQYLN